MVNFLFSIIELFSLALTFWRRYKQILVKIGFFKRGGSFLQQIVGGWREALSPTIVGVKKLECFCYFTVKTV